MKPFDGGQWVGVTRIEDADELHTQYDASGQRLMHLQASVEGFDVFSRSLSIGAETMVDALRPGRADAPPVPGRPRVPLAGDRLGGSDDLAARERVLPLGVQLLREPRARQRGAPDRLRECLTRRRADEPPLLLPVGDGGPRQVVCLLHRDGTRHADRPGPARVLRHRRPRGPHLPGQARGSTAGSSTTTSRSPSTRSSARRRFQTPTASSSSTSRARSSTRCSSRRCSGSSPRTSTRRWSRVTAGSSTPGCGPADASSSSGSKMLAIAVAYDLVVAATTERTALDPRDFLAIDALLDDEERAIRDTVRQFVRERVLPEHRRLVRAGDPAARARAELAQLGLLRACTSTGYGLRRRERRRVRVDVPGARGGRRGRAQLVLGAGVAGDVRDLAVGLRGAEAAVAAAHGTRRGDRVLRADRARRRLGPGSDAHARRGATAPTGC